MHILDRTRSQLDAIADPAVLLTGNHQIIATNAAYDQKYHLDLSAGPARCYQVSHGYNRPCDLEGETCPVRAATTTGRTARVTHVHRHGDREELCDIELIPVEDTLGQIVQFIEIMRPKSHGTLRDNGIIGDSPALVEVLELVELVAPSELPVLLLGETGTGKELFARAVHRASARREGPLVAVECPGIAETLFESELFGHERGAFTGAAQRRLGLVDAARGGTLFLDEIGDLSLSMQVKLLRLLEAGTYRRVGSTEPLRADFRLICATHRDLVALVREGKFREDLYYRIAGFPLTVPPLRDRTGDIVPLARHLLNGRADLHPSTHGHLRSYGWPGNVRQLRLVLERGLILSRGETLTPKHLSLGPATSTPVTTGAWPWGDEILPLDEVERRYVGWAAARGPTRREVAEQLGLSVRQLYRRMS